MAKKTTQTAQHNTSTQKFTQILEIRENVVLLEGGNACIIVRVTATNFALLSKEEQDGKMYAYASLLNSLSFPIQILVRSKKIQILPYLKLLESEERKAVNPKLGRFIREYRNFVENLVTVSTVLDKQFYFIISYSGVEGGTKNIDKQASAEDIFFQGVKTSLRTKAESITGLVERLGLRSHILGEDELTKLFFDIYNQGEGEFEGNIKEMTQAVIVERQKKL